MLTTRAVSIHIEELQAGAVQLTPLPGRYLSAPSDKPVVSVHEVRVRAAAAAPPASTSRPSAPLCLAITGLHATRLTAMDANGKNDAYVKFHSVALVSASAGVFASHRL